MLGLGPWADGGQAPPAVRRPVALARGAAWLYAPARGSARGAWLLSPGLHHEQAGDPRMDRFARVLASAGCLVLSPSLPDLTLLRMSGRVVGDLAAAFEVLAARPELPRGCRPAVFSVSVGSVAALRLAAGDDRVGGVLLYGGFADPRALFRAVTREPGSPEFDPLNVPSALMSLLDGLPEPVCAAWRRFMRLGWQQPALKQGRAFVPFAEELARDLPERDRELFLVGCGARPGARALCERALETADVVQALDPRPFLGRIRCEVHVMHGRGDPVIPFEQMAALDAALPAHVRRRLYPTGLYGHTGAAGLGQILGNLGALAGEARVLLALVAAIARLGAG